MADYKILTIPFARDAVPDMVNDIPNDPNIAEPQLASFKQGFPSITTIPLVAGGIPPEGQDFNGILRDITEHVVHQNKGGMYKFEVDIVAAGGYPKGAVLSANDGLSLWVSLQNNNVQDFNTGTPTQWARIAFSGLDALLNTKADKAVSINAGTGLTGGGNLSANRTLSVSYGTAAGTAAQGNDTRITGAAQKSANLSDLASPATARANLGLGNAATATVQADATDTTAGALMAVGAFGLGALVLQDLTSPDSVPATGFYRIYNSTAMPNLSTWAVQHVSRDAGTGRAFQVAWTDVNGGSFWWRYRTGDGVWQPWRKQFDTGNISSFAQTLLDDADAAAARGTLGVEMTPPGQVAAFARSTAPSGWLKANGAAVSRTTYAALFAAIGTTFGAGDGSSTFNLPDLRGEFLRGWDDGRGVDAGRAFGSAQLDQFENHTHYSTASGWVTNGGNATGGTGVATGNAGAYSVASGRRGAETRPRNIALLACIKY